ncbi:MAG: hypothetical protein IT516_12510 [Burkholderiales bacterium]|nr:hypothetical protein [Burkholderiales bacterium]
MTDDYTYGEFVVDRIALTVRGGSVSLPRPREVVLDLSASDQSDPEIAALLAYVRRKHRDQVRADTGPPSFGPIS